MQKVNAFAQVKFCQFFQIFCLADEFELFYYMTVEFAQLVFGKPIKFFKVKCRESIKHIILNCRWSDTAFATLPALASEISEIRRLHNKNSKNL